MIRYFSFLFVFFLGIVNLFSQDRIKEGTGIPASPDRIGTLLNDRVTERVKVAFNGKEQYINCLRRNTIDFIGITDFAGKYKLQLFKNNEKGKIEIRIAGASLTITANNPFLVLRGKDKTTPEVFQMARSTIDAGGEIFVPIIAFNNALSKALSIDLHRVGAIPVIADNPAIEKTREDDKDEEKSSSGASFTYLVSEKANGTLITIMSKKDIKYINSEYNNNVITVTIQGVKMVTVPKKFTSRKGIAREIEWQQNNNNIVVTVTVSSDYHSHELIEDGDKRLLLTIYNKKFSGDSKPNHTVQKKWKFDVIVLDAGHGGKDYGAIGINNTIEKNINLAVALKLGNIIRQNMKDVKVVYTRAEDKFIELYKRGKIANENNGKLFISIHCNSVAGKSSQPKGYEIYLLRPGRTAEAINIAERENSVITYEDNQSRYGKLTDENFILVSMAHSSYMRYSEKFAEIVDSHLKTEVDIHSKGIKQAGFYVLVGAAMPSILFETGYVTNNQDSRYMKSEHGQQEIAQSLYQAIRSFKGYYAKEIEAE